MNDSKIKVQVEGDKVLEVVVSDKRAEAIWIVLGEGLHSVKCKLTPTRNGRAYAGSIMGREIIYRRTVEEVKADIVKEEHQRFEFRTR